MATEEEPSPPAACASYFFMKMKKWGFGVQAFFFLNGLTKILYGPGFWGMVMV